MKFYWIFLFVLVFLVSCAKEENKISTNTTIEVNSFDTLLLDLQPDFVDTLLGLYTGDFGGSKIRIRINFISPNHAVGYNVHKGIRRNLSGNLSETETDIVLELKEPGDHPFDGIFTLQFDKSTLTCKGEWKALEKKIPSKTFTLLKEIINDKATEIYDFEDLTLKQVNENNISSIFNEASDSLATVYIDNDGVFIYEYLEKFDDQNRVEQFKQIKGSWQYIEGQLLISWQKNALFGDKSIFEVFVNENYECYLKFNERKLYPNFFY